MIVLDANILIRAILGHRVRELLESYSPRGIRFFTPDVAFVDARKYLPHFSRKRNKPHADLSEALKYLSSLIEPVTTELYGVFETEARQRLRDRDETDWPVLASALALSCSIWTDDADFFGTGVAIWTTSRVEIFLKQQAETLGAPWGLLSCANAPPSLIG
jgi:predicted nucleic acid-binding protein